MFVIPVLDVQDGKAVHATGGDRRRYRPLVSVLSEGVDPVSLARAYRKQLGAQICYLADLSAIESDTPDAALVRRLADLGPELWVDGAISDVAAAERLLDAGATRAVIGLETLSDPSALISVAAAVAPDRLAFSLDLMGGLPFSRRRVFTKRTPLDLADQAVQAGYSALIVLDLARVGGLAGPARELVETLRDRYPELLLVVGGGIRDREDLTWLANLGCAGALVGTALHVGRISQADVQALAAF